MFERRPLTTLAPGPINSPFFAVVESRFLLWEVLALAEKQEKDAQRR
jgi:hypothetical protein